MKKNRLCLILICAVIIFSCEKEKAGNKPPTAVAGPDQVITLPTDSISLNGSASNDPDGMISEWRWKKIAGPVSFYIANGATAKTVIKYLTAGSYKFELSVKDENGASAKDTIIVTVNPDPTNNHPPVANAGPDQTITLPRNSVILDGSASRDPDYNSTNYVWTKISGPSSFNIANANALKTEVTDLVGGVYQFELKITDIGGLASKDTIGIGVIPTGATFIIFKDQVWVNLCYQPDMPGACAINGDSPSFGFNVKDTANILPDSAKAILGVWVRMYPTSIWEQVPYNCWQFPDPYPQSNFTYCITPGGLSVWSWFFAEISLTGQKVDVKIAF